MIFAFAAPVSGMDEMPLNHVERTEKRDLPLTGRVPKKKGD